MPKYLFNFTITADAVASMMENPSDRVAAVSKLAEAAGGKLDAYYWMLGKYDGFCIFDLPDTLAAAALSAAVASSGTLSHVETHELIEPGNINKMLKKATAIRKKYQPIGS